MFVAVALQDRELGCDGRVILTASSADGPLSYRADVGGGVSLGVDLTAPGRWYSIATEAPDAISAPLLRVLVGNRAERSVQALGELVHAGERLRVDARAAKPWVRVAVTDALDHRLQLPLDQSLVDAERAVARGRAARTLPVDAEAREVVVGEALQLARQASSGVVRYLRALGGRRRGIPTGLRGALDTLVRGYADLLGEVERSSDRRLSAVLDAWRACLARAADSCEVSSGAVDFAGRQATETPSSTGAQRVSVIDPRQVRARVFALSADPAMAEVTLTATTVDDGPAVLVRVPAFRRALELPVAHRLLVRLIDARSATARGQAVLTAVPPDAAEYFEAVVRVREPGAAHLRADVFDALSKVLPAATDTDHAVAEARRATVFLAEWRRLSAAAQLCAAVTPAKMVRELAVRLAPAGADSPVFAGGPSAAELDALADTGNAEILRRVRAGEPGGLFAMTRGPGGLLAAEFAAADAHHSD